ncbi:MAG: hypothetical protein SGBAC_004123 [Bacillariaceae sp.]
MSVCKTGSRRFVRPSMKGAKLLGSSVRSALGSSASFLQKQSDLQEDSDTDSGFFHFEEDIRTSATDMFWSQHIHVAKAGKSINDEDLSLTGFSDSTSDSSSSLMKSAHTTKTVNRSYNNKEMNASNRSSVSAKTLDPSNLRRGKGKKKKDQAPKRVDFTGNIVDSDDEGDDGDALSRKSRSSKCSKKKKKKSKRKPSTKKKRKKGKQEVRIAIADASDDDAVVMCGSSFVDSVDVPMVSGAITVQQDPTMTSEDTKVEDDGVADLITIPKPSFYQRQTTSGTATSAFSADPSITLVMERIALEDEKYSDIQVRKDLEKEVEELLDENDDLHTELEQEVRRNQRLRAELTRMETKLQTTELKPLKQDDMEILHEEIKRLQEALNYEKLASENLSKESRSEISELQQTVDSLREEVSLPSTSSKSLNNSGLSNSTHSDNGKSVDRLQGELLIANSKVEELEKVRKEQYDEIRKFRHLLDRFKENTGVKELEEKLELSEKETASLRLELENVETDWEEKMRSKEETIEFFLKQLSVFKLQQASGCEYSSRTLTQSEVQDVLRVAPGALSGQPKRFSWLRGRRQQA